MTTRDIAKKAGVSPSSVSRYFTGAENLSEDLFFFSFAAVQCIQLAHRYKTTHYYSSSVTSYPFSNLKVAKALAV